MKMYRGVEMQLPVLASVLLGKNTWQTLCRKLDEPQRWSACLGEEKNLVSLPGIETRMLGP
jgi:hypothetical protein